MPATATYQPTGNIYTDGISSGTKWATSQLTFSFPTSASYYGSSYGKGEPNNNFEAFNPAQQAATRAVLQQYSSVINVKFTEVTETSWKHGDLRYAETDKITTAWAYYPSTSATGGDAWFNNSSNWYDNPKKGNYGYFTIIHETGHAMGLKHPQEARGSFGIMPADRDSIEYTVMSYKSYVGSTKGYYTNEQWSYPQSLMMYDIAALQNMYGANYNTNAGNSVYSWNAQTGEMYINGAGQGAPGGNRVFLTIWDGGGNDTYDFSNYATDLNVNLQPGSWSTISQTQLADLGDGYYAAGNIANALLYKDNPASLIENVIGGSGNDTLVGNAANNSFTGSRGNDSIDGMAGSNTAIFSGQSSDYSLKQNADGSWTVTDLRTGSPDGTDQLKNIQYLQFQDTTITTKPASTTPTATNTPPDAINDSYSTGLNTKLVVGQSAGVLANDKDANGDALSATIATTPKYGTLTLNKDGSFTYTPNQNFKGTDSFTYKASDGSASDTATVTINIGATSTPSTSWFSRSNGIDAATTTNQSSTADSKIATLLAQLTQRGDDLHQSPSPVASESFTSFSQNLLQDKLQGLLDAFEQSFQGQASDLSGLWHGLADQKFNINLPDVVDNTLIR